MKRSSNWSSNWPPRWSLALLAAAATTSSLYWSCSKSESKSDESSEEVKSTGTVALAGDLAASYPQGLSVTAFPQAVDESPGTAATGTVMLLTKSFALTVPCPPPPEPLIDGCTAAGDDGGETQGDTAETGEFDPFGMHPKRRLADAQERLDGTASECFDDDIIAAISRESRVGDTCYGFDYGIVSGVALGDADLGKTMTAVQGATDQSIDGLKATLASVDGIVADATNEACMVKVGRQMVDKAAARVEGTLRVFEGMICQARKDQIITELPAVGEVADLAAAFAHYDRATVSVARIRRLEDRNGRPVYLSRLAFTVNGGTLQGKELAVTLVHSPGVADNVEYNGVMWFQGDGVGAAAGYTDVTSVKYAKSGTTVADQRMRMEMRTALFSKTKVTADVVARDGTIDLNPGVTDDGSFGVGEQNDYVKGMRYFAFDINPSSYAGNISFWANPGGSYGEPARGFLFEAAQNAEDGTLTGCSYSGAVLGTSIRKAVRDGLTLRPDGCYTPFTADGACGVGSDNMGSTIWKQCFKQGADGLYLVDADKVESARGFDIIDVTTTSPTLPAVEQPATELGDVRD